MAKSMIMVHLARVGCISGTPKAPVNYWDPAGQLASTVVTGMDESAGRSSGEGGRRRATMCAPSAATMAPLSVHSCGRGTRTWIPAASHRSTAMARSRELRSNPTPDEQRVDTVFGAGQHCLAREHVGHRLLEGGGDVGNGHRLAEALACLDPAGDRGLEPGKGEVEPVALQVTRRGQPARELHERPVALGSRAVDVRAAGERHPEQPRHLVECLTSRVVDRGAQRRRWWL